MDKKPLVLLADDDADFRNIFTTKLQSAGFEVAAVNDGDEVLPKLEEITPDLVILDLMMPIMNGMDTFTQMKLVPKFAGLKTVFLTSYGEVPAGTLGQDNSGMNYIKKGDDLDKIVEEIKQLL